MNDEDNMEKMKGALLPAIATSTNNQLLDFYNTVRQKFHKALMATLEAHDDENLKRLGLLAAMHVDLIDEWINASAHHSASPEVMEEREFWDETQADIIAALKRTPEERYGDDQDPADWWKK
jgi:hypothetical protein